MRLPALFAPIILAAGAFLAASRPQPHRETAISADDFVDSAGVNVHIHYNDTSYNNFPQLEDALKRIGIRHLRDAVITTTWQPYYDRLNELGRAGIKGDFVTSENQSESLLASFPARVSESFAGYEAPNEYDVNHGSDWAGELTEFLGRLHHVVKSNPALAKYPLIGPSLTQPQSYAKVAAAADFFDVANLHNYPGGRNPGTPGWGGGGYGSIEWNLNLARTAWSGKPVITTEIGYQNNLSKSNSVPEDISGKYLPRLLFEQWLHGIHRTYLYELVDLGGKHEDSFGLLHSDYSAKVAYNAIRNVFHLLADPGPEFHAGDLDFAFSGNLANVHHLLLEKRDGTFYLAIWIEQLGYDVDGKKGLAVPEQRVTFQMNAPKKMTAYRLNDAGEMQSSDLGAAPAQAFQVSDRLTILEISR